MTDFFDGVGDNWEAGEIRNVTVSKVRGRDKIMRDEFYDDTCRDLKLPHDHALRLTDVVDVGAENIIAPIFPIPIPNPFPLSVDQAELDNERIDTPREIFCGACFIAHFSRFIKLRNGQFINQRF